MGDVLVVGEALVDVVERLDGSREEHPGGSPANVALGLARLGRRVSLLTRFGTDARGSAIRALLTASDVDIVPESSTDAPTSTATARLDGSGVASYDFQIDWRLPDGLDLDALVADTLALHTGSIATFLQPGGDAVLALVRSASSRVTVTYDPNARPRLMGEVTAARARVEEYVRHAHVVKVSDEDLAWLTPGEDPEDVAAAWLASGPSVVIVTRGGEGAVGLCAAGRAQVGAPTITVVDTVGAGDSFMSAVIDYLAEAKLLGADRRDALQAIGVGEVEALLRHAIRVSAITCQRAGADPPTRAELAGNP
jgi:fructokinase